MVTLCLMNAMGQNKAASTLGIRAGTVKSRLHRARTKLAAMNLSIEPIEQAGTMKVETRLS